MTLPVSCDNGGLENLEKLCTDAGLTPFHTRITLAHARGHAPHRIARELLEDRDGEQRKHRARRLRRLVFDVRAGLEDAAAMLGRFYPELFAAGRDFAHQLVECVRNKGSHDDRPPGVSGVAPAREAKPVRAGRVVSGDDPRLRQTPVECLRLWTREVLAGAG